MTYLEIQDMVLARFNSAQRPNAKQWIKMVYGTVWDLEDWTFKHTTDAVTVTAGSSAVTGLPADLGIPHVLQDQDGNEIAYLDQRDFEALYYTQEAGQPCHFTVYGDAPNHQIKIGPPSDTSSALWQIMYERAAGKYPSTPLTAQAAFPADTLTVTSTSEFPSAGDALVAGQKITYTAKTATTLTGCTGGAGTIAVGEPVVALYPVAGELYADTDVPLLPAHTHMVLVHGAQAVGQSGENDSTAVLNDERVTAILDGMRRRYLEQERGAASDQFGAW